MLIQSYHRLVTTVCQQSFPKNIFISNQGFIIVKDWKIADSEGAPRDTIPIR